LELAFKQNIFVFFKYSQNIGQFQSQKVMRAAQVHLSYNAPILCNGAQNHSAPLGNVHRIRKNPRNMICKLRALGTALLLILAQE
jgi:hypothetical protein